MGIGAILTLGPDNAEAPEGVTKWIAEIRIEQTLSRATKYAVRFEDDACGGKMALPDEAALKPGQTAAILVPAPDGGLQCLVRGPIVKVKSSVVVGGPSSWFEIHGLDQRQILDRIAYRKDWSGTAGRVVDSILSAYPALEAEPDVEETPVEYDQRRKKLTQNATDLAFIEKIARDHSFEVWIAYAPSQAAPPAAPGAAVRHRIDASFKVRRSPGGDTGPADALPALSATSPGVLRVNAIEGACANVLKFDLDVDAERATRAFYARTDAEGGTVYFDADDPTEPLNAEATPVREIDGERRTVLVPDEVPEAERELRARAVLYEEGWFVKAACSTSRMLFGAAIQPHEVIRVEGVAQQHVGAYQVTEVLHVINASGHLMDLKLRRNEITLPQSAGLGEPLEAIGA